MPPGGLPFLFRQEREERSRLKGVAERSESSNVMIASGNHTLSIASDKGAPLAIPPPPIRWYFWKIEHVNLKLFEAPSLRAGGRGLRGGTALIAGAINSVPPLDRFLWLLSCSKTRK